MLHSRLSDVGLLKKLTRGMFSKNGKSASTESQQTPSKLDNNNVQTGQEKQPAPAAPLQASYDTSLSPHEELAKRGDSRISEQEGKATAAHPSHAVNPLALPPNKPIMMTSAVKHAVNAPGSLGTAPVTAAGGAPAGTASAYETSLKKGLERYYLHTKDSGAPHEGQGLPKKGLAPSTSQQVQDAAGESARSSYEESLKKGLGGYYQNEDTGNGHNDSVKNYEESLKKGLSCEPAVPDKPKESCDAQLAAYSESLKKGLSCEPAIPDKPKEDCDAQLAAYSDSLKKGLSCEPAVPDKPKENCDAQLAAYSDSLKKGLSCEPAVPDKPRESCDEQLAAYSSSLKENLDKQCQGSNTDPTESPEANPLSQAASAGVGAPPAKYGNTAVHSHASPDENTKKSQASEALERSHEYLSKDLQTLGESLGDSVNPSSKASHNGPAGKSGSNMLTEQEQYQMEHGDSAHFVMPSEKLQCDIEHAVNPGK